MLARQQRACLMLDASMEDQALKNRIFYLKKQCVETHILVLDANRSVINLQMEHPSVSILTCARLTTQDQFLEFSYSKLGTGFFLIPPNATFYAIDLLQIPKRNTEYIYSAFNKVEKTNVFYVINSNKEFEFEKLKKGRLLHRATLSTT